jgi:hypothetical protein
MPLGAFLRNRLRSAMFPPVNFSAVKPGGELMTLSLPTPIGAYFKANGDLDTSAMLAPFAADAVVRDERQTHRGTDSLRAAWHLHPSWAPS